MIVAAGQNLSFAGHLETAISTSLQTATARVNGTAVVKMQKSAHMIAAGTPMRMKKAGRPAITRTKTSLPTISKEKNGNAAVRMPKLDLMTAAGTPTSMKKVGRTAISSNPVLLGQPGPLLADPFPSVKGCSEPYTL